MRPSRPASAAHPAGPRRRPSGVAAMGGWVDTTTLQKVYQVADADTMESVVLQPKRLRKLG